LGVGLAIGALAVVAGTVVVSQLPAGGVWLRLAVLMVVVAGIGVVSRDWIVAVVSGVIAFFFADGFVENTMAVLSWHGLRDLVLLVGLVVAGVAGVVVGETRAFVLARRGYRGAGS